MQRWLLILGFVALALLGWHWKPTSIKQPVSDLPSTQLVVLPPDVDADSIQRQIVRNGEVDERALDEFAGAGDLARAAAANYVAARYEYEHQRTELGLRYAERAENFAPEQFGIRLLHAALLVDSASYSDAVTQGEAAIRLDAKSAEAQRILGLAYYYNQQLPSAIDAWERSLQLHPDENLKQQLEKVRREFKVESDFTESRDGEFVLRYENGTLSDDLRLEIVQTLESQYEEIARDLGQQGHLPIIVSIYTRQQFTEITQAPEWVGALNDGRLRIPVGHVTSVSPQLKAVLRHELTHWFVHEIAHRCPVWLNEGIAQLEEPRSLSSFSPQLRQQLQTAPKLPELEKPFLEMPADRAQIAYVESFVAVEYLRSNYGMDGVRRILLELGEGKSAEDALRSATGIGYTELQEHMEESLHGQQVESGNL